MNNDNKKIIVLNEVESTNIYASRLILSDAAEEGTTVLTHFQTSGKGQAGNNWESEAGKNLLTSIILLPRFLNAAKQFAVSKVVSLGLIDFLKDKVAGASIKWPNDIYIGNKKVAGILIENSVTGQFIDSSVVGIGLNLNQEHFISDAPNPVSLKQITGVDYNVEEVAKQVIDRIFGWYEDLKSGNFEDIDRAYFSNLFRAGEWAVFRQNGKDFTARITGIGEFGQLQLEKQDGSVKEFMFKEIEFIL